MCDFMDEKPKINFLIPPTLSPEDLHALLRSVPLDPEEPDPETNYYNNNKFKIRTHIEKGLIDPEILRYGEIVSEFINDDFDSEKYEEYVKQYCAAKGINYETYISERQLRIEELAKSKNTPKPPVRPLDIDDDLEYDYDDDDDDIEYEDDTFDYTAWRERRLKELSDEIDFTNSEVLSSEEIQALLTPTEEDGPLPDPTNISRKEFKEALASGEVDPNLLTKAVFYKLLKSRLFEYNLFEVIYCQQNGIDYNKYMAQRAQIKYDLSIGKKITSPQPVRQIPDKIESDTITAVDTASPVINQAAQVQPEITPSEAPSTVEVVEEVMQPTRTPSPEIASVTDTPLTDDQKSFLEKSAEVANKNLPIKQSWFSKMKSWVRDAINSVKEFFDR